MHRSARANPPNQFSVQLHLSIVSHMISKKNCITYSRAWLGLIFIIIRLPSICALRSIYFFLMISIRICHMLLISQHDGVQADLKDGLEACTGNYTQMAWKKAFPKACTIGRRQHSRIQLPRLQLRFSSRRQSRHASGDPRLRHLHDRKG
jgi:hypothetical protein